jgi:hypothetical protein
MAQVIDSLTVETTLTAPTSSTTAADIASAVSAASTTDRDRANHTGTQLSTTISDFTEAVQDAVGGILTDSSTIDFTYNDAGNTITAAVLPAGVNHNALTNGGGTIHTDHATVSISAGTGLNGGGDITATRTLNHNAFGTAGTYGSASSVPVFVTEVSGHITSVTSTAISILAAAVSDFAAGVRAVALTGYTVGANTAIAATDTILQAFGKIQGQINQINADAAVWTELNNTTVINNSSSTTLSNISELAFNVTNGKQYYFEMNILFRSAASATGIALTLTNTTAAGTISAQVNIPIALDGTAGLFSGWVTSFGDVVTGSAVPAATTDFVAKIAGCFVCTTSGTITPQFRSEVNASQVTVQAGSFALIRGF